MAKMNLLAALQTALEATKAYIDDNHYNQTEVDTLLALKQDASSALKLGTSSSTAFRGDQGLIAYNHSQAAHAPSNAQKNSDITKAEIEAKLTGKITSHTHNYLPLSGGTLTGDLSFDTNKNINWTGGSYQQKIKITDDAETDTAVFEFQQSTDSGVNFTTLATIKDNGEVVATKFTGALNGNANSANKVNNALSVQLNGGTATVFDGSAAKSINITPAGIGASASSHTHSYAGSSSAGGAATSANKVNNNLVIKINGGTTEGTNMFTFNGSAGKTIDIKASALGAPASHTHDDRYYTETEIDTKLGEVQDDIQAAVDGFDEAIEAAKSDLQTEINNEATSRTNADNALDARLDVLEGTGTGSVAKALADAKSYADTKVAAVLDSAPETLDTLNELAAALGDDPNFATTIANQIGGKAPTSHASTATIYGVSSASNYGHAKASGTTPKANGTAAVGSETSSFARGDHVHPLQTSVSGNAGTATKFASAQSVALTGDVTGSASSQAGWSVATTLSNSGVTAGSYGQAENASPAHKGTFSVPYITVDAKGRVTAASTKTITLPADNNTTYTNEKLGNGYGTCATEEATAAKVVTLSNYTLVKNGVVSVKFTYAVPASATMNINSKGAKNIYYKGAAITAGVIKAGDIATFIYDGTQYQLIAIDRWQDDTAKSISGLSVSGKTITYTKVNGTTGTITTQDTTYSAATTSANGLMSSSDKTKLNGIATGAEVNQNAFANVKVGDTTIAADAKQDTLTFVAGSNVTITPDATNDKITIAATDTVYTHPTSGATAGSYGPSANATPAYGATFNVPYLTVNAAGHVTAISTKTVKIPASDNTWRGIQNNLTSTSTTDSLSANQGKVLKDLVDTKADMVEEADLQAMLTEIFEA